MLYSDKYEMPRDKIEKYLLKPGAEHAKEFFDVGYTQKDIELLNKNIGEQFDMDAATDFKAMGTEAVHFSIFMILGVGSKKKRFRTVWRKDTKDAKPRFITAHRV